MLSLDEFSQIFTTYEFPPGKRNEIELSSIFLSVIILVPPILRCLP